MESKISLLIQSFGLDKVLEIADVEPEAALKLLVEEGLVDLEEFFYQDQEGIENEN